MMAVSLPFQQHSNLSKIQSFSYREHSFDLKYSWTWNKEKKIDNPWAKIFMLENRRENGHIFFFLWNVNIDSLWCQNSLGTAWKHENKHNVFEYKSVHVKSEE